MIFQRFLPKVELDKFYTEDLHKQLHFVDYARNDYDKYTKNDFDYFILNKDFNVVPSIYFDNNGTPVVLSCRDHHTGCKKMCIHTPRLPKHILPSMYSDQLAHAVIHCRIVKPMKSTRFSTQFQLFEQKGTFNGIDTFGLIDFQNMEISSELLAHYESLAIVHRKDTNALLSKLAKEKKIGKSVANSRRNEAHYRVNKLDLDLDYLLSGATYVPIISTMRYINDQSSFTPLREAQILSVDEETRTHMKQFRPIWPLSLYPCQSMDSYGARFPTLPNLTSKKVSEENQMDRSTASILWTVMALLSRVQSIWDAVSKVNLCTSQWEGWILNLLSRQCFSNLSQIMNKTDPFKHSLTNRSIKIYNKFNESNEHMNNIKVVFEKCDESILIVDCEHDEHHPRSISNQLRDSHQVIIYIGYDEPNNLIDGQDLERYFNNVRFELRFISATWLFDNIVRGRTREKWNGFVYSRHGGS